MKYKQLALEKLDRINNSVKALISILNLPSNSNQKIEQVNNQLDIILLNVEEMQSQISIEQDTL